MAGRLRRLNFTLLTTIAGLVVVSIIGFTAWRVFGAGGAGEVPAPALPDETLSLLDEAPAASSPAQKPPEVQDEAVTPASQGGTVAVGPAAPPPAPAAGKDGPAAAGAGQGTVAGTPSGQGSSARSGAQGTVALDGPESEAAAAAPAQPELPPVPVTLSSEPRAAVIVDNVPRGNTPLVGLALPAGRHSVTLTTTDGRRSTFTIDVAADRGNQWVYDFEQRAFR